MMPQPVTAPYVPEAASTLAGAFFGDPVWAWAFPDPTHRRRQLAALWTLFLLGSLDHGWVWATEGREAVSLWIPPGCAELAEPYHQRLEGLVRELLGPRSDLVLEVFQRFDDAHPRGEDHYYLSLLGTDPNSRGLGLGMDLLRHNLASIDAAGAAAYLESTNPANLDRYRSVGFEAIGEFDLPEDGPDVTTMWRKSR
jgi:GNAT superfamily N-acetyltransferase